MKTNNLVRQILLAAHPVGSYYWSSEATSPETLFGGSWEQITDKFVYAAGTKEVGETGGEETHTLTNNEAPSHNHDGILGGDGTNGLSSSYGTYGSSTSGHYGPWFGGGYNAIYNVRTTYSGGGQAHNNMPPYITAYCWRRTA